MTEEPENVVVTMRVGEMKASPPPGSRTSECYKCHAAVWIAPSSDQMAKGWAHICWQCAAETARQAKERGEKVEVINPSPTNAQLKEIDKVLGPGWRTQ